MRAVRARRVAVAVWLAAATSGCVVWKVESVPPRELLARPGVPAVRITSTDTLVPRIEIYDPAVVGDSITGHPSKLAVARVFFPLSQVRTIATQHKSFGKTVLVVLAAGGAIAVYALLQQLNQEF